MAREMTHCFVKIPVKPLTDEALDKVRILERKLGVQLIAFAASNEEYARLTAEQLEEVEVLGKEINAVVVAYSRDIAHSRCRTS